MLRPWSGVRCAVGVLVSMLGARSAFADTVTLTAVQDAYVYQANPTGNFGSTSFMRVGVDATNSVYVSYIKWDLSTIPAGSTVSSVTVSLGRLCSPTLAGNLIVSSNNPSLWTESGVTYNTRPPRLSILLTGAISACSGDAAIPIPSSSYPALNAWVQQFAGGAAGITLEGGPAGSYFTFASRSYAVTTLRPKLTVTYTPPPLPDLQLRNLTVETPNPLVGQPITISYQVRNDGTGPAGASTARVYANLAACPGTNVSGYACSATIAALPAQQNSGVQSCSLTYSAPGIYRVQAMADAGGAVNEGADESNNCAYVDVTVTSPPVDIQAGFMESGCASCVPLSELNAVQLFKNGAYVPPDFHPAGCSFAMTGLEACQNYRIDMYVNDMFAGSRGLDNLCGSISSQVCAYQRAGIDATILYSDGFHPLDNARAELVSHAGNVWRTGSTGSDGSVNWGGTAPVTTVMPAQLAGENWRLRVYYPANSQTVVLEQTLPFPMVPGGTYNPSYATSVRLGAPDVHVTIAGVPTVHASGFDVGPTVIGCGAVLQEVVVTNLGNAPLQLSNMTIDNFELSGFGAQTLLPGTSSTPVQLRMSDSGVGQKNGTLRVTSDDPDTPELTVAISGAVLPTQTPGITILIHGFDLGGAADPLLGTGNGYWEEEWARRILRIFGGGHVFVYDPGSGRLNPLPQFEGCCGTADHAVIVHDWRSASNDHCNGQAEAAADALYAAMLVTDQVNIARPIQVIGHSRGCAVASEFAQRLAMAGKRVDHMVYLDPHEFNEPELPTDDYFHDPSVQYWDSIDYCQNFYQVCDGAIALLIPSGHPLRALPAPQRGSTQVDLTGLSGFQCDTGSWVDDWTLSTTHGLVKKWFMGTVSPSSDWAHRGRYLLQAGNREGLMDWVRRGAWNTPRHHGAVGPFPAADLSNRDALDRYGWYGIPEGDDDDLQPVAGRQIFMGDFTIYGTDTPTLIPNPDLCAASPDGLAGWGQHGGATSACSMVDRALAINGYPGGVAFAEHNRLFVPSSATGLPADHLRLSVRHGASALGRFRVTWIDENNGEHELLTRDLSSLPGPAQPFMTIASQPGSLRPFGGTVGRFRISVDPATIGATPQLQLLDVSFGLECESADFNLDGVVDGFDYFDFVLALAGQTVQADFNQDGAIDLFDYLDFLNAFSPCL